MVRDGARHDYPVPGGIGTRRPRTAGCADETACARPSARTAPPYDVSIMLHRPLSGVDDDQVIGAAVIGVLPGHFAPATGAARMQSTTEHLLAVIPGSGVHAFAKSEIPPVLLSVLVGFVMKTARSALSAPWPT